MWRSLLGVAGIAMVAVVSIVTLANRRPPIEYVVQVHQDGVLIGSWNDVSVIHLDAGRLWLIDPDTDERVDVDAVQTMSISIQDPRFTSAVGFIPPAKRANPRADVERLLHGLEGQDDVGY